MNLILFSGFLGSGKTSLILSLAHFLLKNPVNEKPELVIIENEIGEVGIDNKVLKTNGLFVKELFAGCICCQLTSDLTSLLNELASEFNPKWVIVEATGLAYPGKILGTISKYGKGIENIKVITVVDAERWEELTEVTPQLTETQVKEGDVLFISKIDLVPGNCVKNVESDIKKLNPGAEVHQIIANEDIKSSVWDKIIEMYGKN